MKWVIPAESPMNRGGERQLPEGLPLQYYAERRRA